MAQGKKDVQRIVVSAAEKYGRSVIARTVVTAIPYVGSPINELLTGKWGRRWQQRTEEWLALLDERMQAIEEGKVDKAFLESDEFASLVVSIVQRLQSTHEAEKVACFANILSRAITNEWSGDPRVTRYLVLVHELGLLHMKILGMFEKRARTLSDTGEGAIPILQTTAIAAELDLSVEETEPFCADLASRGLLYDPHVGLAGYKKGSYALHPSAKPFLGVVMGDDAWQER
jgi:hypothetical protein